MNNPRFQSRFAGPIAGGPVPNLTGGPDQPPARKPTAFDVLAKLVIPLLAVVVAAVGRQPVFFWVLAGVLAVSVAVSVCPWLFYRLRDWAGDRRDQRLARQAFPQLRKFARRFCEFAASPHSRNDTLHAIVLQELCGGNSTDLEKFHMVPVQVLTPLADLLHSRLEPQHGSLTDLRDAVDEMNVLIRSYTDYCVDPIFSNFPQDARPRLSDRVKSSLESFRERFVEFLNDYDKFLEGLAESFNRPRINPYYLRRPKPL